MKKFTRAFQPNLFVGQESSFFVVVFSFDLTSNMAAMDHYSSINYQIL
jgi:hypothetical protein